MSSQSLIAQIADAVVTDLNAAGTEFEGEFTAERHYRPRFEVGNGDLDELRVSVVPRGISIEKATRAGDIHEVQVDVAVQQKLPPEADDSPAAIDMLMRTVQQIADHMRGRRLSAFEEAAWRRIENEPIYAVDHLDELRVFTSVLTLTYRVLR